MKRKKDGAGPVNLQTQDDQHLNEPRKNGSSRRTFFGQLGGAAAATIAASTFVGPLVKTTQAAEGQSSPLEPDNDSGSIGSGRANKAERIRTSVAAKERAVPIPPHTTNGDESRYADKSASYSKGLLQDTYCRVDPAAWASFQTAIHSGLFSDWQNLIMGGVRTENGPMGSYCFTQIGTDSGQFGNAPSARNQQGQVVVPPFAQVNSADYGTQLIEMYWASLCRDVAFTDYPTNVTAIAAAAELSGQATYRGPRDLISGRVTPELLFRGGYPGETVGPYVSQLWITPTAFGQQAIPQQYTTYLPDIDYMTDLTSWFAAQNGNPSGSNQPDPTVRWLHDGRGFSAYTHVDGLYQAYLNALLALGTIGARLNPGNPYIGSRTQNGFCTFGGPDQQALIGGIAAHALDAVWYQKWLVHLTQRPEAGGGIAQLLLTGQENAVDARLNRNVLHSQAVAQSFSKYGSYLLSQAFPEGSPYHPSYPTGHGTVGGACATVLKFIFDETFVIPHPMVPSNDGLSLQPYTGSDAGEITVGGEINKLAHNVSFGHGIHAGIHWRSDTDSSLILGETYAISVLQDYARSYAEPFTISFTKFDGTTATISNQ
jgi:hypothetical protein